MPQLQEDMGKDLVFQQNRVHLQFYNDVREKTLPEKWIGFGVSVEWPPRSLD
jgi:hypothetical protein